MKRAITITILSLIMCFILCACSATKGKIGEAQAKYRELVDVHNQVVAAHETIEDNSLDDELRKLSESIPEFEKYNLNDMTSGEVDELIASMDTVISSYSAYLKTIGEIKTTEDSSRLSTVYINIINGTDLTFRKLSLEEEGETDLVSDALETLSGLLPGQEIVGLAIHKDKNNTPWVLTLSDKENVNEDVDAEDNEDNSSEETENADNQYQIDIDVSALKSNSATFTILVDEETGKLYLELKK